MHNMNAGNQVLKKTNKDVYQDNMKAQFHFNYGYSRMYSIYFPNFAIIDQNIEKLKNLEKKSFPFKIIADDFF